MAWYSVSTMPLPHLILTNVYDTIWHHLATMSKRTRTIRTIVKLIKESIQTGLPGIFCLRNSPQLHDNAHCQYAVLCDAGSNQNWERTPDRTTPSRQNPAGPSLWWYRCSWRVRASSWWGPTEIQEVEYTMSRSSVISYKILFVMIIFHDMLCFSEGSFWVWANPMGNVTM